MIITIRRLLTAILAITASLPAIGHDYDINIGEFSEVRLQDPINVDYVCSADSTGRAVFECSPEDVSAIMFTNKKGCLTIQLSTDELRPGTKLPTIRVYSRFLTKASNTSDSTLRVVSVNDTPRFEALQEGNGRLIVRSVKANDVKLTLRLGHGTLVASGECHQAKIHFTGTGVIQADALEAQDISVNCSGTGSIGVNPLKSLSVFGAGSTTVYYLGNPSIRNRTLGVKILPLAR